MYTKELAKQSVGVGWGGLIEAIYNKAEQLKATLNVLQVKEKFGGLRFYCDTTEEMQDFVWNMEFASMTVCEFCGKEGHSVSIGGWYKTLCDACYSEHNGYKDKDATNKKMS